MMREAMQVIINSLTDRLGFYHELDFTTLVRPLPDDEDEDGQERPTKRQRFTGDGGGLITFFGKDDYSMPVEILDD